MLKNWQSHQEYRHFLHEAKVHFDDSQRTRLTGEFAAARDNGENCCNCPRHYSDPDAHWGCDSDPGTYYFGYTLYMLSYHDGQLGIDLPLHIRFLDAKRHDSISGIVTLKEFRGLNPDIPIQNLCFDSANDNYPTYNLCKTWNIRPFIDLNANRGKPKSIPDEITIDNDGTPICQASYWMVYWGYCSGRSRCKGSFSSLRIMIQWKYL